jgi:hypothetical protein
LRVVYRCECDLRSDLLIEILEHCTIEVICVVDCNVPGTAVAIVDILPEELFACFGAYVCDRLHLDPLCEVLDCHHDDSVITPR